jgi:hypothetical protein
MVSFEINHLLLIYNIRPGAIINETPLLPPKVMIAYQGQSTFVWTRINFDIIRAAGELQGECSTIYKVLDVQHSYITIPEFGWTSIPLIATFQAYLCKVDGALTHNCPKFFSDNKELCHRNCNVTFMSKLPCEMDTTDAEKLFII